MISAFSSDGRIAAYDLVVLDDPAAALPSYDAMILLGPRVADDPRVVCALAPLRGALAVDLVRRANLQVRPRLQHPQVAGVAGGAAMRMMLAVVVGMLDNRGGRLQAYERKEDQQDQDSPRPAAILVAQAHQQDSTSINV